MHEIIHRLTDPQYDFVHSADRFPLFLGGFGAGKSEALVCRMLRLLGDNPGCNVGYFAPTYDLIRLIAWDRFESKLTEWGVPYRLNKSSNDLEIGGLGRVIFRTLDNPARIVGFEIADAGIDELDTLKTEQARDAWNKIIARCRQKKPNGEQNSAAVATTPEGFRFAYDRWQRNRTDGYVMYRAPTYSNKHLPDGYRESLEAAYPPNLLSAYLEGQFVNLTSGAVYPDFDRALNGTHETVRPNEPVHVGLDFNVYNCTAVVYVIREGAPLAVGELTGVRDTPAMAQSLRERYLDQGHSVTVYPDASGAAHKSVNAAESDIAILRQAGFVIRAKGTNPAVRDRVASVNAMICAANGERRLKVNAALCPHLVETLEQQAYDKNGDPAKDTGLDHCADAMGYPLAYLYPIKKAVTHTQSLRM